MQIENWSTRPRFKIVQKRVNRFWRRRRQALRPPLLTVFQHHQLLACFVSMNIFQMFVQLPPALLKCKMNPIKLFCARCRGNRVGKDKILILSPDQVLPKHRDQRQSSITFGINITELFKIDPRWTKSIQYTGLILQTKADKTEAGHYGFFFVKIGSVLL